MTKTGLSEKLRHYNTLLAALLLVFVCLCPSIGFSNGTCTLTQLPTGQYTIVCEGDGVSINYVDHTNEVYVIENCEELKLQLLSAVDSIDNQIYNMFFYDDIPPSEFQDALNKINSAISFLDSLDLSENPDFSDVYLSLESAKHDLNTLKNHASEVRQSLNSLSSSISSIQCASCSSDGGGSCCDVDLSSILDKLDEAQLVRISISNALSVVSSVLAGTFGSRSYLPYRAQTTSPGGNLLDPTRLTFKQLGTALSDNNVLNNLNILNENLAYAVRSINNYLYKISYFDLPSISNKVDHLYISSINFFSFFRDEVSVRPVLEDWTPDDGGYYDFLTNYYLRVVNNDSSLSSTSKTNWFSRIETLLASLVFVDSVESTNTVDITSSRHEASSLLDSTLDGVSDVGSTSSSQLTAFRDTSQNIVSSLRSISASFSRASDPGTVHLVSLSSDTRGSSDSISFETSDIRNLVEACHCATTLCWCFAGLLLLYYFLHWTVKTSYGLLMFAWGVVSAIFKH